LYWVRIGRYYSASNQIVSAARCIVCSLVSKEGVDCAMVPSTSYLLSLSLPAASLKLQCCSLMLNLLSIVTLCSLSVTEVRYPLIYAPVSFQQCSSVDSCRPIWILNQFTSNCSWTVDDWQACPCILSIAV